MKKHNYVKSILNTEPGKCYLCHGGGEGNTALHHIYGGSYRRTSSENGFYVFLCPRCHDAVHNDPGKGFDKYLKTVCESIYEDRNGRSNWFDLMKRYWI